MSKQLFGSAVMPATTPTQVIRRIALLAMPSAHALEIVGPFEVFARAAQLTTERALRSTYRVELLSAQTGRTIGSPAHLQLLAHRSYRSVRNGIDTLLVVAGAEAPTMPIDAAIVRWLIRMSSRVRRLGSVCAGAFVLAEAGLLNGRKATTHWGLSGELSRRYPQIFVDPDPIFVRDGHIYTSAGVTAGMDLALSLVEEDCGHELALEIACAMVLFLRRSGSQSQCSRQLSLQMADREPLRELQLWIGEHLHEKLSVEVLSVQANMSPRHFARVFTQEVGTTPAKYVERMRVEAARRRLEESNQSIEIIANECGFGSTESMRRTFLKTLRTSPWRYREQFRSTLL